MTDGNGAPEVTPEAILQLGLGFWGSKTLLSAVELGLFTELAESGPLDARGPAGAARPAPAQRDATSSTRSSRSGCSSATTARYANTPATELFLDRAKPSYIGGLLEMANARLYPFWGSLTEGLRTGEPQNEAKSGGDFFDDALRRPGAPARSSPKAMSRPAWAPRPGDRGQVPVARRTGPSIDVGCAQGACRCRSRWRTLI